jgi:hypothetical protein
MSSYLSNKPAGSGEGAGCPREKKRGWPGNLFFKDSPFFRPILRIVYICKVVITIYRAIYFFYNDRYIRRNVHPVSARGDQAGIVK